MIILYINIGKFTLFITSTNKPDIGQVILIESWTDKSLQIQNSKLAQLTANKNRNKHVRLYCVYIYDFRMVKMSLHDHKQATSWLKCSWDIRF